MATHTQPELIPADDRNWKKEDALVPETPSLMGLLDYAVKNQSAIEVIKELRAMQMFDEAKRAERDFNHALELAQNEVSEVVPDATNANGGKYATFKALNSLLRPVYLRHGFTLSFNAAPSPNPEEIYVLCKVSHTGGHSEPYMIPMSIDNKGPKGGVGVMSKQQAVVAATSYGRVTLLKMIFNVAIGEEIKAAMPDWLDTYFKRMENCKSIETIKTVYTEAYREADTKGDTESLKALVVKMTEERRRIQRGQQQ